MGLWMIKAWSALGERLNLSSGEGVGWGVAEGSCTVVDSPPAEEALSARATFVAKEEARSKAINGSDFIVVYRFKSVGDDSITLV